jgi:hypothetical protein
MTTVVVERTFAEPVAFEEIQAAEEGGASCLEAHGVRFLRTYFARDRRRMICLYDAPDAESVRLAERGAGVPFDRAWAARPLRHDGPEPAGEAIVVERRLPEPLDEPAIRDAVAEGAWCLEQHGCRIVWTFLSTEDDRCLCVFEAPDAEAVRRTQRTMGMPFETAWPADVRVPPSQHPA